MPDTTSRFYTQYLRLQGRHEARLPHDLQRRNPYLKRLVRRHFPPDRSARILEVGCGHGALLRAARAAGYDQVEGVDWSPEQVEAARSLGITGVRRDDLRTFLPSLPPASRDVIIAFDVLEHLSESDLFEFVRQSFRVLASKGRFIAHVPNAESPFFGRVRYGDLTHQQAFTRHSLLQLLSAAGFDGLSCHEDTPVIHGPASLMRWLLWKVARAGMRVVVAAETGDFDRRVILTQGLLAVARKS